jgi:hypothetical protein
MQVMLFHKYGEKLNEDFELIGSGQMRHMTHFFYGNFSGLRGKCVICHTRAVLNNTV